MKTKTPALILVSTFYAIEPIMVCAKEFSPDRIVLLREEDAPEKQLRTEELLKKSLGAVTGISVKMTSLYDIVRVAKDAVDAIEAEHAKGASIIVNVSGGRKPQALGALFGAYARIEMVQRIVYVTEEEHVLVDLPKLGFNLSPTKRMVLEELEKGYDSVTSLAKRIGITRGMLYTHLRELKEFGYVEERDGFRITSSGRLAVL